MEFHEIANKYDLLEGEPFDDLCESIREHGLDDTIVLLDGKVLDGRNRYRACLKVGVEPRCRDYDTETDGPDPEDFVERRNENRRHDPAEVQRRHRKNRIARVAEKRRAGESPQSIAEQEGISRAQVLRDLQDASTCPPPGQVENADSETTSGNGHAKSSSRKKGGKSAVQPTGGKVKGKDGRTRTATPKKRKKKTGGTLSTQPMKDALGNKVPDAIRDAFGDRAVPEAIAWMEEVIGTLGTQIHVNSLTKRMKELPYLRLDDFLKHLEDTRDCARKVLETLKAGAVDAVCQSCEGMGCNNCRSQGHVPMWRHEEIMREAAPA